MLVTSLNLGAYLSERNNGKYSLELIEYKEKKISKHYLKRTSVATSHGRKLAVLSDREISHSEPGQAWCFEVDGIVRFHWLGASRRIEYERLELCTEPLLAFWLIHIFLPLYFTLEGLYEFIHACSVDVAGKSILFVAPSHGGKSTLADFFLKQGHTLISDDKVATYLHNGKYFAVPSHPNHRPYRKFEDLGYRVRNFSPDSRSIDAIYALQAVKTDADVTISEISGHYKFARLLPNYLFNFSFLKVKRLKYLAEMVSAIPIYCVEVPWDKDRLNEVHDAICRHLA